MSDSSASPPTRTPWSAIRHWLAGAPVADPVDRRNAPMLQIVLLVIGCTPPLLWLYRATLSAMPWRPAETASVAMSLTLSAVALGGVWLIRRGRFRWAAYQLLGVVALFMVLSYAGSGLAAQAYEQPIQVVWIVIAGLILGRRALWGMYGWLIVAFALGLAVDLRSAAVTDTATDQIVGATISALLFLLIAIVVDRSVAALRESLEEANRHGVELEHVNARLQAEIAEHRRVRDQLVHAQKTEAVGRLAGGIAHDFNNLLGLMLGYAQRSRDSTDVQALRRTIDGMESAARRAAAMSQNLLNFSRHDATRSEVFDAGRAMIDMKPMLQQMLEPGIGMRVAVADESLPVAFDPAQLTLVALNIAANANHAMADGGRFEVSVAAAGDMVDIVFADTGPGIAADLHERIFDPFFTTKPNGEGTGLGLAVAANMVRNAGGTLSVESEPGAGARFRMRLPRVDAAA